MKTPTLDQLFLIFFGEVVLYAVTQITNPYHVANLHRLLSMINHALGG